MPEISQNEEIIPEKKEENNNLELKILNSDKKLEKK